MSAVVLVPAVGLAVGLVGCGGDERAAPCPEAVIDWEGGPSPYRTDEAALGGFLADFPELQRLDDLTLEGGRIRAGGVVIGSYEIESLRGGTVAVTRAEWCFDVGAED